MSTDAATLLAVPFRAFLLACQKLGVDEQQICDAAGVSRTQLEDPNARVTLHQGMTIWASAYQASQDPLLGLHAAQALPPGAYRVFDHLVANSPTVGEAYERIARYARLLDSSSRLEIEQQGAEVVLRMRHASFGGGLPRPYVEYTFATVALRAPILWGFAMEIIRVECCFDAPPDHEIEALQAVFQCPIVFGATQDALVVSRTFYERETRAAEPALFEALVTHAEKLTEAVPQGDALLERTQAAVHSALAGGDPSLQAISRTLGVGARTLQRKLGAQGIKFAELVDEQRKARALEYLRARVSFSEISHLLGYSQDTAFFRAFKRWTGMTPSEFWARPDGPPHKDL